MEVRFGHGNIADMVTNMNGWSRQSEDLPKVYWFTHDKGVLQDMPGDLRQMHGF